MALKYGRRFGCEFEFTSEWDHIRPMAIAAIEKFYGDGHLVAKKSWFRSVDNDVWHLKTDASTGCELCTPVSTIKDLSKVCNVVRAIGKDAVVSKQDSLHVHVGIPDVDPINVVIAWLLIERQIILCFPKHRQSNFDYCPRLLRYKGNKKNIATFYQDAASSASDHHSSMSTFRYGKNKTVEFRMCEGSIDRKTIMSWVKTCMSICEYAKNIDPIDELCAAGYASTLHDVCRRLKLNDSISEWLSNRYCGILDV